MTFSSVGLTAVASLAYTAVVARLLGPIEYSDFATALAVANMLAYAMGPLTPITAFLSAQYMAAGHPEKIRGLVEAVLRRVRPIALAGAIVTMVIAPFAARLLRFESVAPLLVAYGVLVGLIAVSLVRSAIRGAQQFGRYGFSIISESVVRLVCGVPAVAAWPAAIAALAAYMVAHLVSFLWTLRQVRSLSREIVRVPLSDVTGVLGVTAILTVAMAIFQSLDLLLVRHFFLPADAGIYAAAASFARWMALLALPFEALLLPYLTFVGRRGGSSGLVALRMGAILMLCAAVPLAVFAIAPRTVVAVFYGAQYLQAAPLLFALGTAVFVQYASYLTAQVLVSRGQTIAVWAFAAVGTIEAVAIGVHHVSLTGVATILVTTRLTGAAFIGSSAWIMRRTTLVDEVS